jgi:hypothetical protein
MHPRTSTLTSGVETGERCSPIQVGADTAHEIVGSRGNGDGFSCRVDTFFATASIDSREPALHIPFGHVGQVKQHMGASLTLHGIKNTSCDDITRGKFGAGV